MSSGGGGASVTCWVWRARCPGHRRVTPLAAAWTARCGQGECAVWSPRIPHLLLVAGEGGLHLGEQVGISGRPRTPAAGKDQARPSFPRGERRRQRGLDIPPGAHCSLPVCPQLRFPTVPSPAARRHPDRVAGSRSGPGASLGPVTSSFVKREASDCRVRPQPGLAAHSAFQSQRLPASFPHGLLTELSSQGAPSSLPKPTPSCLFPDKEERAPPPQGPPPPPSAVPVAAPPHALCLLSVHTDAGMRAKGGAEQDHLGSVGPGGLLIPRGRRGFGMGLPVPGDATRSWAERRARPTPGGESTARAGGGLWASHSLRNLWAFPDILSPRVDALDMLPPPLLLGCMGSWTHSVHVPDLGRPWV